MTPTRIGLFLSLILLAYLAANYVPRLMDQAKNTEKVRGLIQSTQSKVTTDHIEETVIAFMRYPDPVRPVIPGLDAKIADAFGGARFQAEFAARVAKTLSNEAINANLALTTQDDKVDPWSQASPSPERENIIESILTTAFARSVEDEVEAVVLVDRAIFEAKTKAPSTDLDARASHLRKLLKPTLTQRARDRLGAVCAVFSDDELKRRLAVYQTPEMRKANAQTSTIKRELIKEAVARLSSTL